MKNVLVFTVLMLTSPTVFAEGMKIQPTTQPTVIEQGTSPQAAGTVTRCAKFAVNAVTHKKTCVAKGVYAKKSAAKVGLGTTVPATKAPASVPATTPLTH